MNSSLIIALLSSAICAAGVLVASREFVSSAWFPKSQGLSINQTGKQKSKQVVAMLFTGLATFAFCKLLTTSNSISIAISTLAIAIPHLVNKQRSQTAIRNREMAWPEAIDSLVSGLQSGLSIADAVIALADHGPVQLRDAFARVRKGIKDGKTLETVLRVEKQRMASAISDQVFESLLIAKEFGGKDSNNALRLLAEFVRDDIDMLEEIRTKFGWIRNSAALASAAPWLLLILLSSQKSTVVAFSSPTGAGILIAGVVSTAVAYFWMERVGRLPQPARALR